MKKFCTGARGTIGVMVLLKTDIDVSHLRRLDALFVRKKGQLDDVPSVRRFLIDYIDVLGWASMSTELDDRDDYLLTLFDQAHSELCDVLRESLRSAGVQTFSLDEVYRTHRWPPTTENQ